MTDHDQTDDPQGIPVAMAQCLNSLTAGAVGTINAAMRELPADVVSTLRVGMAAGTVRVRLDVCFPGQDVRLTVESAEIEGGSTVVWSAHLPQARLN